MSAQPPRPFRFTREQYYQLADLGYFHGRRVERIRGEIVEMSAVNWPHTLAKTTIARTLVATFEVTNLGWVNEQGPVTLPDSDPEPDVAVYRGTMTDYTDHPTATDTLLIVEVSDTSLFYDTTTKAELYAEQGIADYWVADVNARKLLVFRDPAPIPAGGHAYRTTLTLGVSDTVTPLNAPAQSLAIADLLP
jgi:Uma2 family endonuclease